MFVSSNFHDFNGGFQLKSSLVQTGVIIITNRRKKTCDCSRTALRTLRAKLFGTYQEAQLADP